MMKKTAHRVLVLILTGLFFIPAAVHAADQYVAAVNINGEDASAGESSGTLPGTSPTTIEPLLRTKDGRAIPLWYDRVFPPLDPTLLKETQKNLEDKKKILRTMKAKTYSIGEQKSFWVQDDNDAVWRQLTATVKKTGSHGYLFVDDTLSIPDASLELYVTEFETMYGVLAADIGTFVDRDDNGKVAILLYSVNDGGSINGYLGGYFWQKDYYADTLTKQQGIRSNEMDIIYIRGNEPTGWGEVGEDFYQYNLTTLVHEYTHLVNFGILAWQQATIGVSADAWIDEMMAMASETMYFKEKLRTNSSYTHPDMIGDGYLRSRIEYYSEDANNSIRNGHGLTYWDTSGDVLSNYALSYIFGQYLSLQASSGQGIFKAVLNYMVANGTRDYQAVAGAAANQISGIGSWENLLGNWAIANIVNRASGLPGYKGAFSLTAHGPDASQSSINNGGVVYRKLDGSWTAPAGAGTHIRFFLFDANGTSATTSVAVTTTTTVSGGATTTTIAPDGSTTTTTQSGSTTTTTASGPCPNSAFPVDCTDVNEGCCPADYPVCCEGGGCCPADYPYCGADGGCYQSGGLCPMTLLLGESNRNIMMLHQLRDMTLSKSRQGQRYITLFYKHAFEITTILDAHPDLQGKAYGLIGEILPVAENILSGGDAVLQKKTAEDMLELLDGVATRGSFLLKRDVERLEKEIRTGAAFTALGIRMEKNTGN